MEHVDSVVLHKAPSYELYSSGGYIQLNSGAPIAGASARIFGNGSGQFSVLGPIGGAFALDSSGLTSARTFSFPDYSGTIATTTGVESFTNKTIAGSTNIVHASHLRTTGTAVGVVAAPPAAGAVLTAVSATAANWVQPTSGKTYTLLSGSVAVYSAAWTDIGYISWDTRLSGLNGILYYFTSGALDIRVVDSGLTILGQVIGATGLGNLAISAPASPSRLALQVKRQASTETISACSLEYN
jgi:hypothetical protein